MPTIDKGSLVICLQALERAIEFNEFMSQSDTVEKDNDEEINYRYELTLIKLAKMYIEEAKKDKNLMPIEEIIKYNIVE
ncbi:MAG: hypothetical protein PVI89_09100 [Desulfobacteraceae bacterium]|jgi:hypothetical protein